VKKIIFVALLLTSFLFATSKHSKTPKKQPKNVQKALELLYGKKAVEKMQKKDSKKDKNKTIKQNHNSKNKKTKVTKDKKRKNSKKKIKKKLTAKNRTKIKSYKLQKKIKKHRKHRKHRRKKIIIKIKKWLQPLNCNPAIKKSAIKVIPITDVDYRFEKKRELWIPVGKKDGLKQGMSLIVCRNIGKQHLVPVSDIILDNVWINNSTAVPISKFDPDTNNYSGIREGDLILFRIRISKKRIVINLGKNKNKNKKQKDTDICPLKCLENPKNLYDKDSFPQFTEDMLKYSPNSKLRKELKNEKKKFDEKNKKNNDRGQKWVAQQEYQV